MSGPRTLPDGCPVAAATKLDSTTIGLQARRQVSRAEREHARYAHEAAMTFRVGGKAYQGRTHNVSRGGVCAQLADELAPGIDVELELVLVFSGDVQSDALRVPARVVWCTTVDDAYQIGFAFRPLDDRRSELLTLFLRYLDDERPERTVKSDDVDKRFG